MSFGQFVRHQRVARNLTLAKLAQEAGLSIAYLSRIERGKESPPPDRTIAVLAKGLGLQLDDLFAHAQRLPPDMRPHTGDLIAAYRGRQLRQKPKTPAATAAA